MGNKKKHQEPDFLSNNNSPRNANQVQPSFLQSQDENKGDIEEKPLFESRRRNISPSIKNKQKDKDMSIIPKKPLTPQIGNQSDEENNNASNDEDFNRRVITPALHQRDDQSEYPTKRITTPSSLYQNENYKGQSQLQGQSQGQVQGLSQGLVSNKNYDTDIRDMEIRMKKKEDQYINEIDQLKQSHKEEILSYQKMLKAKEKDFNDELNHLRLEKNEEIKNIKENLTLMHQNEIDSMEKKTERLLKEQKMKCDSENDTLKRQLEQQIEYNKLASKVETSSKHIDELMQSIRVEKESQISDAKSYKDSLVKLEDRLKSMEDNLNKDKEMLLKEREAFEQDQLERKKQNAEESIRNKGELTRLEQLQSKMRNEEYSIKERYEKEKIDYIRRYDEMKLELDTMKSTYQSKLNEVEYQRKMFEEEKKYFEKYKEDTIKNIDNKKFELDNMKEKYLNEEKEVKSRIAIMGEKEFYLTEKFEEFDKVRVTLSEKEEKIEKDRKELIIAARRIEDSIKALDEKGRLIEKEKNELMKQYNDIESDKMNINSEKIIIEQEKSEIRLRLQSIDMLRMKYITENRPMLNTTTFTPSLGMTGGNNFLNKTMMNSTTKMNQKPNDNLNPNYYSSFRSVKSSNMNMTSSKEGGFNADKYFDSLKNRIHSQGLIENNNDYNEDNNQFNRMIMKEKDYLKKSVESIENNAKMEYEKMRKNHFDSINPNRYDEPLQSPKQDQIKDNNTSFEMKKKESTLDNYEEIQDI